MRSNKWGVVLLVIVGCVGLIFLLNLSMETPVSENMESEAIDLKDVNNNVSSAINTYLGSDNVKGSFTLKSEKNAFAPIRMNFNINQGVLKFRSN
jgi:hypothetical protein